MATHGKVKNKDVMALAQEFHQAVTELDLAYIVFNNASPEFVEVAVLRICAAEKMVDLLRQEILEKGNHNEG